MKKIMHVEGDYMPYGYSWHRGKIAIYKDEEGKLRADKRPGTKSFVFSDAIKDPATVYGIQGIGKAVKIVTCNDTVFVKIPASYRKPVIVTYDRQVTRIEVKEDSLSIKRVTRAERLKLLDEKPVIVI